MTQITAPAAAVASFVSEMNEAGFFMFDDSEVTQSDTTIEEFIAKWGTPHADIAADDGSVIYIWRGLQVAKGLRRGALYAVAVDGGSLSHFDGELMK